MTAKLSGFSYKIHLKTFKFVVMFTSSLKLLWQRNFNSCIDFQNFYLSSFYFYLMYYHITVNLLHFSLPACRRLLFPLLHAEKGRLRNAVANRVPASCWVPKILGTRCDRLTHSAHCLT